SLMSHKSFVWLCLLPLVVVTTAFFLLPMARLVVTGAEAPQGLAGYLSILVEPRYRATLINTVLLAAATTVVTLVVATIAGMFLQRHRFPGRAVLIAMLTFPLAFPGVVVGFMIILLAGRQGLIGDLSNHLVGEKFVFAYSIYGLFLGYLYFSVPRVILTIMAAVKKLLARWVQVPGRCSATSCCLRWRRPLSLPAQSHLRPPWARSAPPSRSPPISPRQPRFRSGSASSPGSSWCWRDPSAAAPLPQPGEIMRDRLLFTGQLLFTLIVAAFLMVPAALSITAGVTVNYFRGIASGVTLQWVAQVWDLYADTIWLSFLVAFATLAVTLLVGVPAAYALHLRGGRLSRIIEELITLPLAIPGLAIALALLLAYGSFGEFRRSWLFILVGHVIFTMPFMVRSVMAVFATVDVKTLDEGAASLG